MEELKLIIETVAHLPTMTLWVLCGYLVYKLAVIGSVFGLIRYGIQCGHDWLMHRHEVRKVDIYGTIQGMTITADNSHDRLIAQLNRLIGKRAHSSCYIHAQSVTWLQEAIDEKEAKDREAKK